MRAALAICVGLAGQLGCVSLELDTCGDRYCSPGLVCGPDANTCVLPEQIEACEAAPAGTSCSYASEPDGFCSAGVCIGALTPPENLAASDGTSVDGVSVSWSSVAGATGYRVFRDGTAIIDVTEPSYTDEGATAAPVPLAPVLSATAGTFTDRVELQWSSAETPAGTSHAYTVTALAGEMMGPSSAPDAGFRGEYPVVAYELSIDGGPFVAIGSETSYVDTTAAAGAYAATATASDGKLGHIALSVTEPTSVDGQSRQYDVRAVSAAGPGAIASDAGYRSAGVFAGYQWQRSTSGPDSGYTDLVGATAATHTDTTAAVNVATWYRAVLVAPDSDPGYATPDVGWRVVSDTPRGDPWVIDGGIEVALEGTDVLHVGGGFTYIGKDTGSFVAVDGDGVPDRARPRVRGAVYVAIPDGAGGWYIGGDFTSVGGIDRSYLARINSAGELDATFDPGVISSDVSSLALSGGVLYFGGNLTSVDGQPRNRIAAVDATTGALLAGWDAAIPSGFVNTIVASGGLIYVGGTFSTIGGQAREGIAALDPTTGLATSWNALVSDSSTSLTAQVEAILVSGSSVYIGGLFDTVGAETRNNLASVDVSTGAPSTWNPDLNFRVRALAMSGTTLYVGGEFRCVGPLVSSVCSGVTRNRLAAFAPDEVTGNLELTAWDPNADNAVYTIVADSGTIYAGGPFKNIGGELRRHIAAIDASTGQLMSWDANANNTVYSISPTGGVVYVGGVLDSIGGHTRKHLAAFDLTTGDVTPWNPDVGTITFGTVSALALDGTTLYFGGSFTTVAGQTRTRLAAVDATSGALTSWSPSVTSTVNALVVHNDTIYAAGLFTSANSVTRNRLAAFDLAGALTAWDPNASSFVHSLVLRGDTFYVAGNFTAIGGQTRNRLGAIDASTGAVTSWNPSANSLVNRLVLDGDTFYVGGTFTAIGAQTRNRLAAVDLDGAATSWDPNAAAPPPGTNDPPEATVTALAVSGNAVYVGGFFSSVGGQTRQNAAALDKLTGAASDWQPSGISSNVDSIHVVGDTVYLGHGVFISTKEIPIFDP